MFYIFSQDSSESEAKPNDKKRDVQPNKDTNDKSDEQPKKGKSAKKRDVESNEDTNNKSDEQPEKHKSVKKPKGAVKNDKPVMKEKADVTSVNEEEQITANKRENDKSEEQPEKRKSAKKRDVQPKGAVNSDEPVMKEKADVTSVNEEEQITANKRENDKSDEQPD